jgi:hypothetical protein
MPITRIEVRRSRSPQEIERFIEAVYQAQQESLKVPKWDRQILYIEHPPQRFAIPPGWSENYTLVDMTLLPGRPLENFGLHGRPASELPRGYDLNANRGGER